MERSRLGLSALAQKADVCGLTVRRVPTGGYTKYEVQFRRVTIRVKTESGHELERTPSLLCQNFWEVERVIEAWRAHRIGPVDQTTDQDAGRDVWPAGRTIARARPMSRSELDDNAWDDAPAGTKGAVVLELDDGSHLYPSQDEEGNGPGALFFIDAAGDWGSLGLTETPRKPGT